MELFRRSKYVMVVAVSMPIKLVMFLLGAESAVKVSISTSVMVAPRAFPSVCSIAFRRLVSGMLTFCGGTTIWSNSTVTLLLWRTGIWLFKDRASSGFPVTKTLSPLPNPVFATRGAMSDIAFSCRFSSVRLVNLARGEMSDMMLLRRFSSFSLVNLARGEMSVMLFLASRSTVRLVNPAICERSATRLSRRSSNVRLVNPTRGDRSAIALFRSPSSVRLVAASSPVKLWRFSPIT